jgi:phosphatidylserine/phosphatidylglycerophosphate/cardiolipin synthase-like enzyme
MFHREVLETIAGIDASPFGTDAKTIAQAQVDDTTLKANLERVVSSPRDAFLLIWRCVTAAQTPNGDRSSPGEFVVTLPTGVPKGARPTNLVVTEMLEAAKRRVVVLGYTFTHHQGGTVERMVAAASRGVDLVVVCDRGKGGRKTIEDTWPSFVPRPKIYVNAETDDEMHKMHCKMIIVDESDLLVTSANFTYHGMLGNIEFGVRLRDVASSKAALSFVEHLIKTESVLCQDATTPL